MGSWWKGTCIFSPDPTKNPQSKTSDVNPLILGTSILPKLRLILCCSPTCRWVTFWNFGIHGFSVHADDPNIPKLSFENKEDANVYFGCSSSYMWTDFTIENVIGAPYPNSWKYMLDSCRAITPCAGGGRWTLFHCRGLKVRKMNKKAWIYHGFIMDLSIKIMGVLCFPMFCCRFVKRSARIPCRKITRLAGIANGILWLETPRGL